MMFMPAKREIVNGFMIHYKPYETDHGYKKYVVHGSDERQAILTTLLHDTTYSLRMQSFNSEGFSDYSNTAVKKTMGPSDNSTDNYPLDNYTPLFPAPADDLPPFDKDTGAVNIPRNPGTTVRSGIESQVPLSRSSYSQQNTDLLFVVLGGVLGAVFIVVVFIVVFCFWRQRQQQLLIAALQARTKATNIHAPHLHANGFAAASYEQESVNSADPNARKKRAENKRDHIPGCVGGCPKGAVGGCPKGAAGSFQPTSQYCCRCQPTHDEWNSQEFPLVAESVERRRRRPMREDYACANSNYGSRSDVDTSDGDSVTSSCPAQWTSAADSAAEMYNSEMPPQPLPHPQPPHPLVTSSRPARHLPSKNCQQMINSCDCNQFSCQPPSTELLESPRDALQKLNSCHNEGNNSQSGQSDSLPRSCTSDCSSSSSSSSTSMYNRRCLPRQQNNRETNDSGVYDEATDCKHHSTTNCRAGDQCHVMHN